MDLDAVMRAYSVARVARSYEVDAGIVDQQDLSRNPVALAGSSAASRRSAE
jgi:hypothetical protein